MTERAGRQGDRSRARPRHRTRARYALREFLLRPLLVAGSWVVLAVVATLVDRNAQQWGEPLHEAFVTVVPPGSTTTVLSTVTPGLLTVISIIFFVLLMAVQHQSATYSPVVLDQFLRRKVNQAFYGMFVGLTVYCLLTLALVPPGQAVVSSALAVLLASATFATLLIFVYTTVDQIRPSSTMWMLQQLAVRARESQQPLLARSRTESARPDEPAIQVLGQRVGYVVHIDVDVLARAFGRVSGSVEVEFRVSMGEHVVPGAVVADVRGGDSLEHGVLIEAVLDALTLGRMRDIDRDAAHAVDHLGSISWSATASSNDPEGARIAVETLHSLLVEFKDQDGHHSAENSGGPLPLVYNDRIISKIIDALVSVVVASGRSGQHQTCGDVLTTLSRILPVLPTEDQRTTIDRIQRVLPTAMRQVFTAEMEEAFDAMCTAMREADQRDGAQRVEQLKTDLWQEQRLAWPRTNGSGDPVHRLLDEE